MKIANIEDTSRNEIQQLQETYYSLQQAYFSDNKDDMINAFIKAKNLNIPYISNKIMNESENVFHLNGLNPKLSVPVQLLHPIELRLNVEGCLNALLEELNQRKVYTYAQSILYRPQHTFFKEEIVYRSSNGNQLKVSDLLSLSKYAISIAEIIEPNNEKFSEKKTIITTLQSIDAILNNKPEDKPVNKKLHLITGFIASMLGTKILTFLNRKATDVINSFESAYYFSRKTELEQELESIASALQSIDIQKSMKELRSSSLQLLKDKIAKRYNTGQRKKFTIKDIKRRTEEFLKEYPIVLSTTYSSKSCISKDMVFDYVIMDEASQVDIKTGALALSCAMNAVIVGDDKQLPNVVSREEELALRAIQTTYQVDDRYNAVTHSFLQSCVEIFQDAPVTLLREHYRCHPKIIEFCNQRFYNGELIAMTTDEGEKDVLQVIRTVPGNHARGHFNQREIDVITQEVLSECTESESIGIITPYRAQAEAINQAVRKDISSTVHKYQGRECDTIIMSMVDNSPTEFSDDANLLNVAISRAKSKLCLVTNGNEMPEDSNLSQLISYIQYNNFEVKSSKLHSVFDLLYQQYTAERLAYEAAHPAVSEHLSENLIYDILLKAIAELGLPHTGVLCHYPLSRLITDWNQLEDKEKTFAESPFSHIDFLLYNSLTKQPISAIEVDGWHFHKENDAQLSRDKLKNQIFTKLGLPLIRISTTDTVNQETIKKSLLAIL